MRGFDRAFKSARPCALQRSTLAKSLQQVGMVGTTAVRRDFALLMLAQPRPGGLLERRATLRFAGEAITHQMIQGLLDHPARAIRSTPHHPATPGAALFPSPTEVHVSPVSCHLAVFIRHCSGQLTRESLGGSMFHCHLHRLSARHGICELANYYDRGYVGWLCVRPIVDSRIVHLLRVSADWRAKDSIDTRDNRQNPVLSVATRCFLGHWSLTLGRQSLT